MKGMASYRHSHLPVHDAKRVAMADDLHDRPAHRRGVLLTANGMM